MSDEQETGAAPEIETQAREMGWRPKEEFKGDEAKWVDASTFVERGEHVLPIVKETNKRLRGELATTNAKLNEVTAALTASQESIKALEKYHQADVKTKVDKARADLKAQLVAAKKAGDVEGEVELTEELTRLNTAESAAATREDAGATAGEKGAVRVNKDYTNEPEFIAWKEDNPWFGDDEAKTAIAQSQSIKLRMNGDKSVGRAFLDKVAEATSKEVARLSGRPVSRVEASRGGSGGSGSGGGSKSFASLPAEAKKACNDFARDLVGPNKAYKTVEEWQKKYTQDYYSEV